MDKPTGLDKAIDVVGTQAALASLLGVKAPSIWEWKKRNTVPASRVLEIERLTGVSRHDLRPDLYPLEKRA